MRHLPSTRSRLPRSKPRWAEALASQRSGRCRLRRRRNRRSCSGTAAKTANGGRHSGPSRVQSGTVAHARSTRTWSRRTTGLNARLSLAPLRTCRQFLLRQVPCPMRLARRSLRPSRRDRSARRDTARQAGWPPVRSPSGFSRRRSDVSPSAPPDYAFFFRLHDLAGR